MENLTKIKPSLPDDVIELEILPKLPPSSLNRFKLVSKKWYSLITADSYFTTLSHLHPHSNSILVIARPRANKPTNFGVFFLSRDLSRLVTVDMSYMKDCPDCPDSVGKINHYVGCCNGLVCFTDYNDSTLIWNPATREFKHLPQPLPTEDDYFFVRHIGFTPLSFGYDDHGNDYKLVRIAQPHRKNPSAQVFSLRRSSWRHAEKGLPRGKLSHSCKVNVNGVLYWMGCRSEETNDYFVLSFDLRSEEFHEINLPPPVRMGNMDGDEFDDLEPDLIRWKDSLGLLVHDGEICSHDCERVLWLMGRECGPGPERSWTKLGKVLKKPIGLWFGAIRNDRFVMSRSGSSSHKGVCNYELYLYEPFSQLETTLPIREREDICEFAQVFDYSESLVSLSVYTGVAEK